MPKADVLQLVTDLGANRADGTSIVDQTAISTFYDDIVFEMGLGRNPSLTGAAFVQATKSVGNYVFPTTAIRLLLNFYDDTSMHPSDTKEAEAYDKQWRTSLGDPRVWLVEQETDRTFTVVPVPRRSGAAVGVATPFGTTFPEANFTTIYTENRADVHAFEELIVALQVFAREFDRESDHTDHDASKFATDLASLFQAMLAMKH